MAEVTVKNLRRSSTYAGAAQIWRIASRVVLTPIIIAKLGLAGYGTWTLLFSACGCATMFHTSFGHAYTKFTAEYDAKRDYGTLAAIIGSGITLIGTIGLVCLTILCLAGTPMLTLLGVPEDLLPSARQALLIVALCVLLRMSFGCVFGILAGLQRVDLEYKIGILASAVEFAAALALLHLGYGLLGLAVGHLIGQVCATAIAWLLCRRLCPQLHISPIHVSRQGLRLIGSLGGRFQLLALLTTVVHPGPKLVISALCGVSVLAVYELAVKLMRLAAIAGSAIIAPLTPAFANWHARQSSRDWQALYVLSSKLVSVVSLISLSFMAIFADHAILLWTGEQYPLAAWTLRVTAVGQFVHLLTGVGTASLRGRGTLRAEGQYLMITASLMALLLGPAYWLGGYRGIIVTIAGCFVIGPSWFLVSFARQESLGIGRYLRGIVAAPVLCAALPAAVITTLRNFIPWHAPESLGRWGLAADLALWGLAFAVALGVPLWYGVFSSAERNRLRGFLVRSRQAGTPSRVETATANLDVRSS